MAKTPIKRTGLTKDSVKNFIINAGVVYKNLEYTGTGWEGERLGATAGGNQVTITNEFREIEVDGAFSKYVGEKMLVGSDATLTTNVKEITAEVIKNAILGEIVAPEEDEAPTGYDVIKGKAQVEDSDYLENIALVGELSGTKKPIIIVLDNALCTSGLDIQTGDDAEAVVTMVFEAHADGDQVEDRTLPARIYYPKAV